MSTGTLSSVVMPRWYRATVVAWAVAALLVLFFDTPLRVLLWVLVIAVWLGLLLAGLILGIAGMMLAKRRNWAPQVRRWAVAPFVLLAVLVLGGPVIRRAGDATLFRIRFTTLRPRYDAIVADVAARKLPASGETRGVDYQSDPGPPVRVVFPQPGGIIDNWEGVIYDPTGAVRAATSWRGPGVFSAPPEVRTLFGGDLLSCKPVSGSYYRCWFT